jgi:integrase
MVDAFKLERTSLQEDEKKHYPQPHQAIYPITEGLRSPRTIDAYSKCFKRFKDYIRIHDEQVLLDYSPKIIESFIIDYVRCLRDEKQLKYMSIQVDLAAIFHFFEMNDFNLSSSSKKKVKRFLPSDDSTHDDRPYTVDEIGKILSKCDERSKVIILLMTSTGMRIGAIHALRIGHLTEVPFQGLKLYRVQVYAGTRDKYFTFCTPECYNAIQDYLQTRKRFGEIINDKSPLIREQFNVDDKLRIHYPKSMSHRMIIHLVDQALKRSGVKTSEAMRSHAFRKFFMTQCEKSRMNPINVKMLLGHDIGLGNNYYRPTEFDLLEDYMTHAVDALTVSSEDRLKKQLEISEEIHSRDIEYLKRKSELYDARAWEVLAENGNFDEVVRQKLREHVARLRNGSEERKKMNEVLKKDKETYYLWKSDE